MGIRQLGGHEKSKLVVVRNVGVSQPEQHLTAPLENLWGFHARPEMHGQETLAIMLQPWSGEYPNYSHHPIPMVWRVYRKL